MLKFEGLQKGQRIRAMDFATMECIPKCFIEGEIIQVNPAHMEPVSVYAVLIDNDSGETEGGRVGDVGYVPMGLAFGDFDERVQVMQK